MAKKSTVERLKSVKALVKSKSATRDKLKKIIMDKNVDPIERFALQLKLAAMPRNSSATRVRNRCCITGRARGYYRKFNMSRISFREMAADGLIPGIRKASW